MLSLNFFINLYEFLIKILQTVKKSLVAKTEVKKKQSVGAHISDGDCIAGHF